MSQPPGLTRPATNREPEMLTNDDDNTAPLLSVRTALIILLAVLAGVAAGVLTGLARHSPYEAVLVGLATAAAATKFFHWLIS